MRKEYSQLEKVPPTMYFIHAFSSLTFLACALNHGLTSYKVGFVCQGSLPFE
jgi:hypothetical protein